MKSTDIPARYVGGNFVDLLSWYNIYIHLRTITVLHKKTKVTRFELIYNVLAHTHFFFEIRHTLHIAPNFITDIHIWTHQICSMYLSKDALILVIMYSICGSYLLGFKQLKQKTELIKFSKNC